MDHRLTRLTTTYIDLESRVRELMTARCGDLCGQCSSVCCKIDFCREALESPFLILIRRRMAPACTWHSRRGWLGQRGCGLRAGRPPVCYAFYCRSIAAAQATALDRYVLDVLAALMTYVGRRARGSRHLIEMNDLGALNLPRLARQMDIAGSVLAQLQRFWSGGAAPALELLQKVYPAKSVPAG